MDSGLEMTLASNISTLESLLPDSMGLNACKLAQWSILRSYNALLFSACADTCKGQGAWLTCDSCCKRWCWLLHPFLCCLLLLCLPPTCGPMLYLRVSLLTLLPFMALTNFSSSWDLASLISLLNAWAVLFAPASFIFPVHVLVR